MISSVTTIFFVVLTLDIRRYNRALRKKLVPSAFGTKFRELFHRMKNLNVVLTKVWHRVGSIGPVSEIIMRLVPSNYVPKLGSGLA